MSTAQFWFWQWRAWGAMLLSMGLLASASAQPSLSEAQAKAAFVLNLARYIEWPANAFTASDAPLTVCLAGRDSLGAALLALEGRTVQGRILKVRRGVTQDDMRGCQLVYIDETEERRVLPVLRLLAGQSVLTISAIDHFVDMGGAVGLVLGEDRLLFEVNRAALSQAQLKASSKLLHLARNVP